jgi:DNA-binding CsgD family transcriptional regulator
MSATMQLRVEPEQAGAVGEGRAPTTRPIRVCVVEEHEVFHRGIVASLREGSEFRVCGTEEGATPAEGADVAVVSDAAIARHRFDCPLVLCTSEASVRRQQPGNVVAGILARATMTEAQLHATVRAVAAGLRVNMQTYDSMAARTIDDRAVRVAELLACGYTTQEIARDLSYSDRTVKKVIKQLEGMLHARGRAQIVAHAIRQGVI